MDAVKKEPATSTPGGGEVAHIFIRHGDEVPQLRCGLTIGEGLILVPTRAHAQLMGLALCPACDASERQAGNPVA
jgi:hypothetical protein